MIADVWNGRRVAKISFFKDKIISNYSRRTIIMLNEFDTFHEQILLLRRWQRRDACNILRTVFLLLFISTPSIIGRKRKKHRQTSVNISTHIIATISVWKTLLITLHDTVVDFHDIFLLFVRFFLIYVFYRRCLWTFRSLFCR